MDEKKASVRQKWIEAAKVLEHHPLNTSVEVKCPECEPYIPEKKALWAFLGLMLLVCIPTALFGVYTDYTKPIILPLTAIFSGWALYLLFNEMARQNQINLFSGLFSGFISLSFLLAAYKIAATAFNVSWQLIALICVTLAL